MKEIFDWLRKQMENVKTNASIPDAILWNEAVEQCLRKVTEAEAKWQEDCCKYTHIKNTPYSSSKCNEYEHKHDIVSTWNRCPYCGKRIKIAEVE